MKVSKKMLKEVETRASEIDLEFCMHCGTSKKALISLVAEIRKLRKVADAARKLLNDYLKDSQYPENITFPSHIVSGLRNAVVSLDETEETSK